MRPTRDRSARVLAAFSLLLASPLGCMSLDELWSHATAPVDAAVATAVEPLRLSPVEDPSRPPQVDEDAGGSALEPEPDAGPVDATDAGTSDAAAEDGALADAPLDDASLADASVETDASVEADAGVVDTRPTITALGWRTGVVDVPRRTGVWVGYLRAGARIAVVRGPVGNDGCPARRSAPGRGWYEVDGGGYVCVGALATLTANLNDDAITSRLPAPPDLAAAMPFTYARTERSVPIFRRLPSNDDERAVEALRLASQPSVPGPVRIEDLAGPPGSAMQRRALAGMYVSLRREERAPNGTSFWHTQSGGYVRAGALSVLAGTSSFQGAALDAEHPLPVAFAMGSGAATYRLSGRTMVQRARLGWRSIVALTSDPPVTVAGETWHHTTDGGFVRARQVRIAAPHAPPSDLAPDERWIDVNLDRQIAVAYEGARPVYVTLVSTGRRDRTNPDENYETVQGSFRILSKHVATTMDGNSGGGPYSIEDVPWVMYFDGSFALHGAFWHGGFGATHSHGCVNLSPPDARWFYEWTGPHVPAGWGGVYATPGNPGTRVYVHYDHQALGVRGGPVRVPGH